MKNLIIFFMILATIGFSFLTACSPNNNASIEVNCSVGKEVCINIDKIQPFTMGQPMLLNINVSSTKDFSDLNVLLQTAGGLTIDGPQSWENYLITSGIERGIAYWDFAIKAGQALTFKRVLRFPMQEGYYQIIIEVVNKDRSVDAISNLHVLLEQKGVQIIMSGTPIPSFIPNETLAVYGPGTLVPTNSIIITNTPFSSPLSNSTSTQFSPLVSTSTPLTSPYPPPPSSSPTPTPQSSPYP